MKVKAINTRTRTIKIATNRWSVQFQMNSNGGMRRISALPSNMSDDDLKHAFKIAHSALRSATKRYGRNYIVPPPCAFMCPVCGIPMEAITAKQGLRKWACKCGTLLFVPLKLKKQQ
jgi:hypothetical protein